MIITRTPFRISFFGGGTDYPAWFLENGGSVLGTTIDKYCYITCRYLPPFFEHRHRIVYSKVEVANEIDEIWHPSVRECLKFMSISGGVEIHHDGDLPARTGLGSSSSFTVGLLHALYALKGKMPSKMQLAREAIHVEQELIKENVGCQDQVLTASGGLCRISFGYDNGIDVCPVTVHPERIDQLQKHMMMFFTGLSRTASDIAGEQIKETPNRKKELTEMHGMVDEAVQILNGNADLKEFGKLLHQSWQLKRSLTNKVTTPQVDEIYEAAMKAGAIGGKLLGAGGGGFMIIFARPELQPKIKEALGDLLYVPFRFEKAGTQMVFYEPNIANGT
ncbi:MAG: kinase [Chloroflexi bacterium]|nr:kinase [Chloroflexota bacterium]